MHTREHHVVSRAPNWAHRWQGFQPLTHRDDDWRRPMAPHRRAQAVRRAPLSWWRRAARSLPTAVNRLYARWLAWLDPPEREELKGRYFLLGMSWLAAVFGSVFALTRFL